MSHFIFSPFSLVRVSEKQSDDDGTAGNSAQVEPRTATDRLTRANGPVARHSAAPLPNGNVEFSRGWCEPTAGSP